MSDRTSQDPLLEELSPELQELVSAGQGNVPSAAQLSGLADRLGPLLEAPVSPPPPTPPGPSPDVGLIPQGKVGMLVGAGIALAVAAGIMSRPVSAPEAADTPSIEAKTPARPAAADSTEQARVPEPRGVVTGPSSTAADTAAPPPSTDQAPPSPADSPKARLAIPSESKLLEQARQALKTDPARALSLTRRHKQLYPRGQLNQEREVLAIEALSRLKRTEDAKARAGKFENAYPESAHQKKIEDAVEH